VFIFHLVGISNAQMTKILPFNSEYGLYFGDHVFIDQNRLLIYEWKHSHNESGIYYRDFFCRMFQIKNRKVDFVQSIPEEFDFFYSDENEEIFDYPYFSNDHLVFCKYWDTGNTQKLYLFRREGDRFLPSDSVDVYTKNITFENYILMDQATNGEWLFYRKQSIKNKPNTEPKNEIWDFFYKIEQGKLVFMDSVFYKNTDDMSFSVPRTKRIKMTDQFLFISDYKDDTYGQKNGSVLVYKLVNNSWEPFQKIHQPEPANGNSIFGYTMAASPDGKFVAATAAKLNYSYQKAIYIFEFKNDQYEFVQKIPADFMGNHITLSIDDQRFFIGDCSPTSNAHKGKIYYYQNTEGIWEYKSTINPPVNDVFYNDFGFSIDHFGETVLTGATGDTTMGLKWFVDWEGNSFMQPHGAAYVFQVPARDTLDISICEGESYWFGEEALTMSGEYRDTLPASYGVDSVVVLNLSVLPPMESEVDTVLCSGQELKVGDQTLGEAGYYTIPLKNIYGCDSIVSVSLSYAYLDVEAEVSPDFGCQNGKISLLMQGNDPPYSYQWSNGAITSETLTELSPGVYAVTVTDRSGCSFTLNDIEIKEEKVYELPDAFIPSSQMEENQRFRPYLFPGFEETVTITEMDVFNRFGEKVYSGTDTMGWDGTFRGEPSPPGSYLFRIILNTPCGEEMRTGSLLLVR